MYKAINYKEYIRYQDGLSMQKKAFEMIKEGKVDGILLILEHYPVYTIGTNGGWENLLYSKEALKQQGIDIIEISRGGNITFHGLGQIVAYPIFNLEKLKKDAHWYIDCLENVVIDVLREYEIRGSKKSEYRGVWVEDNKIAAIGVHVKKWITLHGLSFNIGVDKKYFDMINPCGITKFGISSLKDYVKNPDLKSVKQKLIESFENVFEIQLDEAEESLLENED